MTNIPNEVDFNKAYITLNDVSKSLFKEFMQFENIENDNVIRPLLKEVITKKYQSDELNIKVRQFIDYFDKFKTQELIEIFNPVEFLGIAVFFMPGTDAPIPFYYGNWPQNSSETSMKILSSYPDYHIEHFDRRIDEVAQKLRNLDYPFDKLSSNESGVIEFEHFFFWIRAFMDLQYRLDYSLSGLNDSVFPGTSIIKKYSPSQEFPTIRYTNSTNIVKEIVWKTTGNHPNMVISPIYINHDTFVLVVSFFEDELFMNIEKSDDTINNLKNFNALHNVTSSALFDFIYNAILREDNREIFKSLQRGLVSKNLLKQCSKNLRKGSFSYEWKRNGTFYSSDIRSHITGDYKDNPDNIFNVIVELEENMFNVLRDQILNSSYIKSQSGLNNFLKKSNLPDSLPNSKLLKDIENTQRSLKMVNRDHIIHQFQVFLLGSLFINKYKEDFILSLSNSLSDFDNDDNFKQFFTNLDLLDEHLILNDKTETIETILKFTWLITSLNHDIGYPVEVVDETIEELKEKVTELPSLSESYKVKMPKLNISPVMYDDPRAYILMKEIAYSIAARCGNFDDRENWWYLIRYLTFEKKRHELISVLSLGFKLISNKDINSFINSSFGFYSISNILVPISLHHISDWEIKMKSQFEDYPKNHAIREIVGGFQPKFENLKVSFTKNPIAVLLILCDSIQETGRPSGNKKDVWPYDSKDYFEEIGGDIVYSIKYFYREDSLFQKTDCENDYNDKFNKVKKLFDNHIIFGPLHKIKIRMEAEYSNKELEKTVFNKKSINLKEI